MPPCKGQREEVQLFNGKDLTGGKGTSSTGLFTTASSARTPSR